MLNFLIIYFIFPKRPYGSNPSYSRTQQVVYYLVILNFEETDSEKIYLNLYTTQLFPQIYFSTFKSNRDKNNNNHWIYNLYELFPLLWWLESMLKECPTLINILYNIVWNIRECGEGGKEIGDERTSACIYICPLCYTKLAACMCM